MVLPESEDDFLVLQPVSGSDREIAGVLTSLEQVEPATFPLPDVSKCGGVDDWRLLRDAVRFGFRSSIGPFRSLARIGVAPRAYQLVPLMMALKLDPVRLLIADDVGIGKTVEALLIARELLDQGDVSRLAVLCSPFPGRAMATRDAGEVQHQSRAGPPLDGLEARERLRLRTVPCSTATPLSSCPPTSSRPTDAATNSSIRRPSW